MAEFWNKPNNYLLQSLTEQEPVEEGDLVLPLIDTQDVSVSLISGKLPDGMRVQGTGLVGTPAEVLRETEYTFVLRATRNNELQDRTFRVRVSGPDQPYWLTPAGLLPVGPGGEIINITDSSSDSRFFDSDGSALFILDNEVIDFQLEADDTDLLAGDELIYYIQPGDGVLPPGITLSEDGRLQGVVEPLLALDKIESRGGYDTVGYDSYPLDFAIPTSSGYGSFYYDTQTFDFNLPNPLPKKLNRYYEFAVTVADKVSDPVRRKFLIYVVGDDFLKDLQEGIIEDPAIEDISLEDLADQLGGVFTANLTFIRKPIWITPADLGFIRADNYATIYLDTLKSKTLSGVVTYSLESENPDGSPSTLPPGTELSSITGEVVGYIPSQPAITREYKFTVLATRITFDSGTVNPSTPKTFTIKVLGEIDSIITWITPKDLGVINSGIVSTLRVTAETTVPDSRLLYRVVDGELPEGLRLSYRGDLIGRPTLSSCDCSNTGTPGEFSFTVEAADRFKFSASTREFIIKITNPDGALYSNLYLQPFQTPEKRRAYRNFVGNPGIFTPQDIYRPNDPNFGTQSNIRILAYAGIERADISKYVAAAAKNHKRRRYNLGDVKRAIAKRPGTNEIVYEVIYVEVVDPAEPTTGKSRDHFGIQNKRGITADSSAYDAKDLPEGYDDLVTVEPRRLRNDFGANTIKADSDAIVVSQQNDSLRYLSNTSNMRNEIEKITISKTVDGKITQVPAKIEREYMPLWMRTGQDGSLEELGFVTAIPLAYCKPGRGSDILLNVQNALKNDGFEFNSLDLEFDRYILDNSLNFEEDQYIIFANYHYNE